MNSLIQCKNLTLQYDRHIAVQNVSFSVEPGDFLCIVGENGSGKSTLLKGLLGLLPPHDGQISYAPSLSRTAIGYVPQQSTVQRDFPATVWEIVLSGCLARRGKRPFFSAAEKKRAHASLDRLGIADLCRQSYRALSGGQQQRVLLARALCAADQLFCLDEPATGLDPKATASLYQLLHSLCGQGMAIVMVSHDLDSALCYAKHILHMDTHSLFYGTADAYRETALCHRFLGGPAHV